MPCKVWDEITYPFPKFNGATVEVWEWMNNFILYFIMDVITYPCWDKSYTMSEKKTCFFILTQTVKLWYIWSFSLAYHTDVMVYSKMTSSNRSIFPVGSPHKGQWRGALMFSLICVWINGCVTTIVRLVIWDAIGPIMTSLKWKD